MESKRKVGRPRIKDKKVQIYFSVHPKLRDCPKLDKEIKTIILKHEDNANTKTTI
jgi:hypothetical protein